MTAYKVTLYVDCGYVCSHMICIFMIKVSLLYIFTLALSACYKQTQKTPGFNTSWFKCVKETLTCSSHSDITWGAVNTRADSVKYHLLQLHLHVEWKCCTWMLHCSLNSAVFLFYLTALYANSFLKGKFCNKCAQFLFFTK